MKKVLLALLVLGALLGILTLYAPRCNRVTRRVLAELGIWPESAAVSLKAAKDALLRVIPEKASAMTQTELFEKAGVITKTTGQRALNALLAEKQIQRIGKGVPGSPFRYFKQDA